VKAAGSTSSASNQCPNSVAESFQTLAGYAFFAASLMSGKGGFRLGAADL